MKRAFLSIEDIRADETCFLPSIDAARRYLARHRKARQIFISVDVPLPTEGGKFFPASCNIPVSFDIAMRAIKDLMSESFTSRGGKIKIHVTGGCIFVGGHDYSSLDKS